ncbi:hypothetical protein ACMYSQ_005294 [Aspergillus niger]
MDGLRQARRRRYQRPRCYAVPIPHPAFHPRPDGAADKNGIMQLMASSDGRFPAGESRGNEEITRQITR